jgi:hypothetical protein
MYKNLEAGSMEHLSNGSLGNRQPQKDVIEKFQICGTEADKAEASYYIKEDSFFVIGATSYDMERTSTCNCK